MVQRVLVAFILLVLVGCSDKRAKHDGPCEGIRHAELTMGQSTDPNAPIVPFNQAEFVADRSTRFTNFCSIVAGSTEKTQCRVDAASGSYRITYPDAAPFYSVTLRVFDRYGALQHEEKRATTNGVNIFDDCPEEVGYLTVRYVLDPPGNQPDSGTDGDSDAKAD